MRHNPVSKKWAVSKRFADYEYSSASFYEKEIKKYEKLGHIKDARPDGPVGRALNYLIAGIPMHKALR
jgi:hypothetical protein